LSRSNSHFILPAIVDIYLFWIDPVKIPAALVIEIDVRYRFSVKIDNLVGGKYHGRTQLQYAVVGKCFNNEFSSYAIQIANRNPYKGSLLLDTHAGLISDPKNTTN
jgi:hypothetical protein